MTASYATGSSSWCVQNAHTLCPHISGPFTCTCDCHREETYATR